MSDDPCPYEQCGNPDCVHRRKLREKAVALLAAESPRGAVGSVGPDPRFWAWDEVQKQWVRR
jgi:hypothetical protein